jgi:hypothetical protein
MQTKIKDIPYPNMVSEVAERAAQRGAEKYRLEQLALYKQEQAKKTPAELEADKVRRRRTVERERAKLVNES